jgi:hypothetical protein
LISVFGNFSSLRLECRFRLRLSGRSLGWRDLTGKRANGREAPKAVLLSFPARGDTVKITTYPVHAEDVAAAGAARAEHFGNARPGSATPMVHALVNRGLIEIDAVAGRCRSHTLICLTARGGTSG